MARALDDIIKELDAGYAPSRNLINEKVAALPQQLAAEEQGLRAQEQDYFTNTIMGGARERGVGFSGIPEGERARYGATQFLPALARLKTSGNELRGSLMEALAGINREQRTQATGIRQGELDRDEQIRQFNAQLAAQERQAAAARAAASRAMPTLGAMPSTGGGAPTRSGNDPTKQQAMVDVQAMLGRRNTRSFYEELVAINRSAQYGNPYDQAKLELLMASQPGLFRGGQLNEGRVTQLLGMGSSGGGW